MGKTGGGASTGGAYLAHQVRAVNVERVKRIFSGEARSQFWPFIQARRPMQWGGMSDPFCNFERKHGTGLELLRFFKSIDYPLCFSTKGTWWLDDARYTDLFRGQANWNVKVSIITLDERKARAVEPGVPLPAERLRAIEKIAALGAGGATLRLRPFIIGITDPHHAELIRRAGAAGAGAVSTEFLCVETRSKLLRARLDQMSRLAGFDIFALYKACGGAGYLRLNRKVKRPFVDQMEVAARAAGLRFYVSDAHFKERCDNGSCCGLPPSWNYSRGQFCEALMIAKAVGTVRWSQIAAGLGYARDFLWRQADGFNTNSADARTARWGKTMFDVIHDEWNSPGSGHSPLGMYGGILAPAGRDDAGDVIYRYDPTRA